MASAAPLDREAPLLLGFVDEELDQRSHDGAYFATNKIGGLPIYPPSRAQSPLSPADLSCGLCSSPSVLICQIYAPLDGSPYHRVLYVFACLTPQCWNKPESWKCFRTQQLDSQTGTKPASEATSMPSGKVTLATDWLDDADDWGDDDYSEPTPDSVAATTEKAEEENGNIVTDGFTSSSRNLNELTLDRLAISNPSPMTTDMVMSPSPTSEMSEPSSSCSSAATPDLGAAAMRGAGSDGNANASAQVGGARLLGDTGVTAEIEDEQDDVVAVETPPPPEMANSAIPRLFGQAPAAAEGQSGRPGGISRFKAFYLAVDEERFAAATGLTEHEKQLLRDYQEKEHLTGGESNSEPKQGSKGGDADRYEKVLPKHGDVLFHKFVSVVQQNPGQVLRYTRDPRRRPLFLSKPATGSKPGCIPTRCVHCHGSVHCELQVLPSLLPFLHPDVASEYSVDATLEFGTVLVYSCTQSCWQEGDSFKPEAVLVQEEDV